MSIENTDHDYPETLHIFAPYHDSDEVVSPVDDPSMRSPPLTSPSLAITHDVSAANAILNSEAEAEETQRLTGKAESSLSASSQSQISRPEIGSLLHTWRWELSIWLLGTAGLIANIILLVRFDGVEQNVWKASVQITAFVAALSQLSQTALLVPTGASLGQLKWRWFQKDRMAIDLDRFDLASRGPDGSLRLLWHLRLRPHLATLGALSTLLMLAFPTFVQQSVAIETRLIQVPKDNDTYVLRSTGTYDLEKLGDESIALVQAMLSPYINPVNITGNCPTSNCSWESYSTLSVCAAIEDATSQLIPGKLVGNDSTPHIPNLNSSYPSRTAPQIADVPSALHPQLYPNTSFYYSVEISLDFSGWEKYDWDTVVDSGPVFAALPNFANVYLIYFDICQANDRYGESNWDRSANISDISLWKAVKARLHPCIQTYKTMFEGIWQAEIVDTDQDPQGKVTMRGEGDISYCIALQHEGEFCIEHRNIYRTGQAISVIFNATGEVSGNSFESTLGDEPKWYYMLKSDFRNSTSGNGCNSETSNNLKNRFDRIAASLSLEMHNAGVRHNGTAWRTAPVIVVTFPWLIMPITLYTVITLFFFTTIIRTKNSPPWKSSALALLQSKDPDNRMASTKQFKQYAKATSVRLEHNGETWHLLESTREKITA